MGWQEIDVQGKEWVCSRIMMLPRREKGTTLPQHCVLLRLGSGVKVA